MSSHVPTLHLVCGKIAAGKSTLTDRLGQSLRQVYEGSIDTQPIPDSQIDLLLRLRHKERDRRRAG